MGFSRQEHWSGVPLPSPRELSAAYWRPRGTHPCGICTYLCPDIIACTLIRTVLCTPRSLDVTDPEHRLCISTLRPTLHHQPSEWHAAGSLSHPEPQLTHKKMETHDPYRVLDCRTTVRMTGKNLIKVRSWRPRCFVSFKSLGSSQMFSLEKTMVPHSNTLAWKIPWTEEPGRLPSMGSWRVGHDRATSLSLFTFMRWRRQWQPTPVFLPGESQGWGSLVGCRLWGRTESDTTEAT